MYNPVETSSRSILWPLRYLEWLFLSVHGLLDISDQPLDITSLTGNGSANLLFNFFFYGLFILFSFLFPIHRPRWQRQLYILLAMICIICANFLDVSLDLLIYLYIAKSFFLLGYQSTLMSTIVMGIAWIISECISEIKELEQGFRFEPPFGFGSYSLGKIAIHSFGIYVAVSVFVFLFSSVVCAEHRSRKRSEALAEQVEILAADLERTRIARDIHDSLGHTLTNLDIQLEVAQKLRDRDPQKAFLALDTAKKLSSQCIDDVSHAVKTMRYSEFNLERTLSNLIEQIRNSQALRIRWEINLPQLPIATSHHIYCVVKEGLINIQKHAYASSVYFQGQFTATEIVLQLEDDGVGFDLAASTSGSGLKGMAERVQGLGGQLSISSSPNQGTKVLVVIPR